MTWYESMDQLPDIDDYDIIKGKRTYRYFDGNVLYPFGYGLTYTTFAYDNYKISLKDNRLLEISRCEEYRQHRERRGCPDLQFRSGIPLPFAPSFYKIDLSEVPVLIGCAFVMPAAWIYKAQKTKKNVVIGMAVGTVFMATVGGMVRENMEISESVIMKQADQKMYENKKSSR